MAKEKDVSVSLAWRFDAFAEVKTPVLNIVAFTTAQVLRLLRAMVFACLLLIPRSLNVILEDSIRKAENAFGKHTIGSKGQGKRCSI